MKVGSTGLLWFFTLAFAWSWVIPMMVQPDGTNLRPFQFVVAILVVTAVVMLLHADPVLP